MWPSSCRRRLGCVVLALQLLRLAWAGVPRSPGRRSRFQGACPALGRRVCGSWLRRRQTACLAPAIVLLRVAMHGNRSGGPLGLTSLPDRGLRLRHVLRTAAASVLST